MQLLAIAEPREALNWSVSVRQGRCARFVGPGCRARARVDFHRARGLPRAMARAFGPSADMSQQTELSITTLKLQPGLRPDA